MTYADIDVLVHETAHFVVWEYYKKITKLEPYRITIRDRTEPRNQDLISKGSVISLNRENAANNSMTQMYPQVEAFLAGMAGELLHGSFKNIDPKTELFKLPPELLKNGKDDLYQAEKVIENTLSQATKKEVDDILSQSFENVKTLLKDLKKTRSLVYKKTTEKIALGKDLYASEISKEIEEALRADVMVRPDLEDFHGNGLLISGGSSFAVGANQQRRNEK